MKHDALVYNGSWNINIEQTDIPQIDDYGILVEIQATGICGTDMGIIMGKYNATPKVILGHESSGIVKQVGSKVSKFKENDRVYIDPTFYCGECFMCRTERPNHCELKTVTETGVSAHGTNTKFYVTTERFLYHLPEHVSFEGATLAEPLSCAMTGVRQLSRVRPDARVVVLGSGTMGLMYAHALSLRGIVGSIIEISEARKELAQTAIPNGWNLFSNLDECAATMYKQEFDIIVDTTGALFKEAVTKLARGGQLLLVGLRDAYYDINPMHMVDKSQRVIGSIDSEYTFNGAVAAINNKQIPVDKIVTHTLPLSEYHAAFKLVGVDLLNKTTSYNANALKVVMRP